MLKLLNRCVIFVVYIYIYVCVCVCVYTTKITHTHIYLCVCNLQMWPRATGWTPTSQGLCKNNAVIALIFPCPAQIAVWFLMWTIRILILEAMNINYLLGWFYSVHMILSETQKGAYVFIYGNAPGLENILQYTATYFLHLVRKLRIIEAVKVNYRFTF